jgi:hypothetical protein
MHAPKANPRLRGVRLLGMAQKLSGQLRHSQKDKMINIPLNSSNPNAENPHAACVSLIVPAFWQNVVDGMSYLCFFVLFGLPTVSDIIPRQCARAGYREGPLPTVCKQMFTLLDECASSLRRGHANLLCTVPILSDDRRRGSNFNAFGKICTQGVYRRSQGQQQHVV